ncbi:MAG: flagellar hook-associated protein FlgL [Desulfosalsimonas sp.]
MIKSTLGMNYRTLSSNLENMSNKLYDIREKSATGKEINSPSDDPSAIRPLLNYETGINASERYLDQMSSAGGEMDVLDSSLDQVENVMAAAKEAGISAMSDGANQQDRETYADRVGQLFDEMLQLANQQTNGKYIFAGYEENTQPFSANPDYDPEKYDPDDPDTWAVEYHGDGNAKQLEISPGKQIQVGLAGNELFLGDADNDDKSENTDVFSALKDLEHSIRNWDGDKDALQDNVDKVDQGADQVRRLRSRMGNNALRIERASGHLEDQSNEFKKIISDYEDADMLEVFSELLQQETAFEAALNVTTRISKLSILDFM